MPIRNIARVEVVRGPGSALYGADAFAGVINIITKSSNEVRGLDIGLRAGSFSSFDTWVQWGGKWLGLDAAISVEHGTTDGFKGELNADSQTAFDALFGTSASLAPGRVNAGKDSLEVRMDLAKGDWRFRAGYQGRLKGGTVAGAAQALDVHGHAEGERFNADLTYQNATFSKDWDVTAQISYLGLATRSDLVLFPPGAFNSLYPGAYPGAFPNGVIGNPDVYERHARAHVSAFYTGLDRHRIRVGTGVHRADLYKVRETKNYTILPSGLIAPHRLFVRMHARCLLY